MFSKNVTISLKNLSDKIHIEPLGDIHIGHVGFDEDHYKARIKAIVKDPNRYTFFMGDQLDAINIYDKRYNRDSVPIPEIDDQRQKWQNLTQPLIDEHMKRCEQKTIDVQTLEIINGKKKLVTNQQKIWTLKKGQNPKIWGLLHGNHEYKIREITRTYLENHFCYPNGIDFLGAKAYMFLDIKHKGITKANYNIMAMHGSGGGKPETLLHQMQQKNYMDIFFCGHVHRKYYTSEIAYDANDTRDGVWERETHHANTGTFCRAMSEGVSGYMDTKNQVIGTPIGTCTISIDIANNKVNGHV